MWNRQNMQNQIKAWWWETSLQWLTYLYIITTSIISLVIIIITSNIIVFNIYMSSKSYHSNAWQGFYIQHNGHCDITWLSRKLFCIAPHPARPTLPPLSSIFVLFANSPGQISPFIQEFQAQKTRLTHFYSQTQDSTNPFQIPTNGDTNMLF